MHNKTIAVLLARLPCNNLCTLGSASLRTSEEGGTVMVTNSACAKFYVSAKPKIWVFHRLNEAAVLSKGTFLTFTVLV
jgi:hypothetical protein